jgi:hypothetical protein
VFISTGNNLHFASVFILLRVFGAGNFGSDNGTVPVLNRFRINDIFRSTGSLIIGSAPQNSVSGAAKLIRVSAELKQWYEKLYVVKFCQAAKNLLISIL